MSSISYPRRNSANPLNMTLPVALKMILDAKGAAEPGATLKLDEELQTALYWVAVVEPDLMPQVLQWLSPFKPPDNTGWSSYIDTLIGQETIDRIKPEARGKILQHLRVRGRFYVDPHGTTFWFYASRVYSGGWTFLAYRATIGIRIRDKPGFGSPRGGECRADV